jgi:hypothetical protein
MLPIHLFHSLSNPTGGFVEAHTLSPSLSTALQAERRIEIQAQKIVLDLCGFS